MKSPTYSVVIAVYNGEKFIQESIESALKQTHAIHEIIVIDDGSNDGTATVLKQYKNNPLVSVHSQKNRGQGAARNVAIARVSSDYVLFLDADDKLDKDLFAAVHETIMTHPGVDLVHFNWKFFTGTDDVGIVVDEDAILQKPLLVGADCDRLLSITNYFSMNNVFSVKFLVNNAIQFSEGMIYEDNVFMVKASTRANMIAAINKPLYLYRRDNEQSSSRSDYTTKKHLVDSIRAMNQSIDVLTERTDSTAFYLLQYYLEKMVIYYQHRIPTQYRSEFIQRAVDSLARLNVKEVPSSASKFARFIVTRQLVNRRRYKLVSLAIRYKVFRNLFT